MKKLIIAGAGPAGLAAAISAPEDYQIHIIEAKERPGIKLLATGGGRCNVTNTHTIPNFIQQFQYHQKFITPALTQYTNRDLRQFLLQQGVKTIALDGFHVFPNSQKASDILYAFYNKCLQKKIQFHFNTKIQNLIIQNNTIQAIQLSNQQIIQLDILILATGGKSYPILGATGDGYKLVQQAGHNIIQPLPGLVALQTKETWPTKCAGIVLPNAQIKIPNIKYTTKGELLFTHQGISGPAVLDISAEVAYQLTQQKIVKILCTWNAEQDIQKYQKLFQEWHTHHGKKNIRTLLSQYIPQNLVNILYQQVCNDQDYQANNLPSPQKNNLSHSLHNIHSILHKQQAFPKL